MKFFLSFFAFISFSAIYAQEIKSEKDITIIGGVELNQLDYGRFGLMYRQKIQGDWQLKLSATYDVVYRGDLMHSELAFESDSLRIYRTQSEWDRLYTVQAGVDFEPNKYISFGAGLLLGLNSSTIGLHDYGEQYDTASESWNTCTTCLYDYHGRVPREQDNGSFSSETSPYSRPMGKNTYLIYGLSLSAGVNIPLSNRWEIGLVYSSEITRHTLLKSDIYYKGTDLFAADFSSQTRLMHYTDLHLRFRL